VAYSARKRFRCWSRELQTSATILVCISCLGAKLGCVGGKRSMRFSALKAQRHSTLCIDAACITRALRTDTLQDSYIQSEADTNVPQDTSDRQARQPPPGA